MIDKGQGSCSAARCLAAQWMIAGPFPAQFATIEVTT